MKTPQFATTMEIRTPQTPIDRINYILSMQRKIYPDQIFDKESKVKGTTIAKLCEWGGPGYERVKKWCENTLASKEVTRSVESKSIGNITIFPSGAVRDTQVGKIDFVDVVSWTAMNRYAAYMTSKKVKYGGGNFKKGIPVESYEKSLLRHIDKYIRNKYENGNDEINEDHLSAIVFNAFGLIHEQEQSKLKSND